MPRMVPMFESEDRELLESVTTCSRFYSVPPASFEPLILAVQEPSHAMCQWFHDILHGRMNPLLLGCTDEDVYDQLLAFRVFTENLPDFQGKDDDKRWLDDRALRKIAPRYRKFLEDGKRSTMRGGRRNTADPVLVVWAIRMIEVATSRNFGFSRPSGGRRPGAPDGPMFRLLKAMLVRLCVREMKAVLAGYSGENIAKNVERFRGLRAEIRGESPHWVVMNRGTVLIALGDVR